jgi:isoquinoline 1-oxidoreductase
MLHGKILRPPTFDATLAAVDTSKAEAMDRVTVVRDGNFIGVTAPDALTASRALDAIKAEWTTKPQPSAPELFDLLKKNTPVGQEQRAAGRTTVSPREILLRLTVNGCRRGIRSLTSHMLPRTARRGCRMEG